MSVHQRRKNEHSKHTITSWYSLKGVSLTKCVTVTISHYQLHQRTLKYLSPRRIYLHPEANGSGRRKFVWWCPSTSIACYASSMLVAREICSGDTEITMSSSARARRRCCAFLRIQLLERYNYQQVARTGHTAVRHTSPLRPAITVATKSSRLSDISSNPMGRSQRCSSTLMALQQKRC